MLHDKNLTWLIEFGLGILIAFQTGCSHFAKNDSNRLINPFSKFTYSRAPNVPSTSSIKCNRPPPPVIDPPGISFNADSDKQKGGHSSMVDPEKLKRRNELVKPLSDFNIQMSSLADRISRTRDSESDDAHCMGLWLTNWAESNAMTGLASEQGVLERALFLSGVSLAYLRSKQNLNWLTRISQAMRNDFAEKSQRRSRRNNWTYWAGLGAMSAGITANRKDSFDWGIGKIREGIFQVDAGGRLPLEMERGTKSLHYHNFALQPMMMAALLANANQINLLIENESGIIRLASSTMNDLKDPSKMEQSTGFAQEIPGKQVRSWIEIYNYLVPGYVTNQDLKSIRPAIDKWLGGNLSSVFTDSE